MNVFLQGISGVGKTTLLREVITPYISETAGFTVRRLTEKGAGIGFCVASLKHGFPPPETEFCPEPTGVFILRGRHSTAPLEETILGLEREICNPGCRFVLMDEIGGIELTSRVFMDSLKRILSGKTPCLGVFKSGGNMERMAKNLNLGNSYCSLHRDLETLLCNSGELITLTKGNRGEVYSYLSHFVKSN